MTKESFYFSHDYNARNDEKILELRSNFGAEGYGVFWMLIETMAENANGGVKASLMGGLSVAYGIPKARLIEIVDFCILVNLLFEKDGFYFSQRLLDHKAERKFLSDKGKEGAEQRKKNKEKKEKEAEAARDANRGAIGDADGDGNTKERKGKESKEVTSTYNPQTEAQPTEKLLVREMIGVWKKVKPRYIVEESIDFPAMVQIALKIAKAKGWKQDELVSDKMEQAKKSWETIAGYAVEHSHYCKMDLNKIKNQWNGLIDSMDFDRKEKETKEAEKLKQTHSTATLIPKFSNSDLEKYLG
jgi:hypothetical protein